MDDLLFGFGLVVFITGVAYSCVFKIKDIYYGLPSSLFSGRFKGMDAEGYSIPIREAYTEGLGIKWPWWTITPISKEVITKEIKKKKFQVSGGGTVLISGVIQYRPSLTMLYRFEEVADTAISDGLDSELNQILGIYLLSGDMEAAITRRAEVSQALWNKLTGEIINPTDPPEKQRTRKLFGKKISYTENSYGVVILKASIDTIDPDEELQKSRDEKQREQYQKQSQTTEWEHLLGRMEDLQKKFPELKHKDLLEAVQVWQKQATKDIKEIKGEIPAAVTSLAASLMGGKK